MHGIPRLSNILYFVFNCILFVGGVMSIKHRARMHHCNRCNKKLKTGYHYYVVDPILNRCIKVCKSCHEIHIRAKRKGRPALTETSTNNMTN